jgi:erythromycin esterase-like protein
MANSEMRIAQLDEARLAKVKALEDELGFCIVAVEPEFSLAELSADQVKKLQAAEDDLGVVLLAYVGS